MPTLATAVALPRRAPWPLPAILAWAAGWAVAVVLRQAGLAGGWDLVAGCAASAAAAMFNGSTWRRTIAALGFPVSAGLALAGTGTWPAWAWLLALAPLALMYPVRAWRDAPFFPTPADALADLPHVIRPAPAVVLDAGCGLGHGLRALRRAWPGADTHGIEWSAPMAWLAAWRCPGTRVRRGDMWALSWAGFDLVYLFQRPETMPRAWAKAQREMRPGAWLVSLEFVIPGVETVATLEAGKTRPVHVYRVPPVASSIAPAADSTSAAARR